MNALTSFLFGGATVPPRLPPRLILAASFASALAAALLALTGQALGLSLMLGSFGASCVLIFGYPDSPFSQPRNVILGHFLSTVVALAVTQFLGHSWWTLSLSLGLSVGLMMTLRATHPPAGSNPVIVHLLQPGWEFAISPTLVGALALVALAWIFKNWRKKPQA